MFSGEFKHAAVELADQLSAGKAAIARDLGIGANFLEGGAEMPTSMQRSQLDARRNRPRNISECGVRWRKSRRSATYYKARGYFAADLKRTYAFHVEARCDIAAYIVEFYNSQRLHSVTGTLLPCVYERKMAEEETIAVSKIT
ncbi:hypothetical protein C5614_24185 [Massilia phosphatilytica]|nr:hypothetical protein C5614_24185 [Massilia phosphatilytica]